MVRLERLGERAGLSEASLGPLAALPDSWAAWLASAVHEEETELAEAIRPTPGTWRDGLAGVVFLQRHHP